jgi:hypothetical protein
MIRFFSYFCVSFFLCLSLSAQSIQKKPAAEKALTDNIYYAEAGTSSNPADMTMTAGDAVDPGAGTFTRISQHKDYSLTITRLVIDLGKGSAVTMKDLTEGLFKVIGTNKSNEVIRNIKAMTVTDNKGYDVVSGRYVTIDLDFGFDSDADNAYVYTVVLNKDLGKYKKGAKFVRKGRILRK